MKPVRIVSVPSADTELGDLARALLARLPSDLAGESATRWLEAEVRRSHPTAVVRAQVDLAKPYPEAGDIWYVSRGRHRTRISKSLTVALRAEAAFRLYTERVVEWQSAVELRPIHITGSLVGDEYDACYRLMGREYHGRFRIMDARPPEWVRTEAGGSGISVWYVTRFMPIAGGTRVVVEGDYVLPDGLVPRIADRLFIERAIDRDIERAHATFATLAATVASRRGKGSPGTEPR